MPKKQMLLKLFLPMTLALSISSALQMGTTKAYAFTSSDADTAIAAFNNAFWDSSKNLFWADTTHNSHQSFWIEAELWELVMDSYLNTSDPTLKSALRTQIDNTYDGAAAQWGADWTSWNHYNDDITWWAMASARAYKITGEQRYLDAAEKAFNFVYNTQWDDSFLNGGIWWMNSDHSTKNAVVTFPVAETAIDLYNITGDSKYLDAATRIYRWGKTMLTDGNGKVFDRIEVANGVIQGSTLYNQGTFIGAAVGLYNITGDTVYLDDAVKAANYTETNMVDANHILNYEGGNGDLKGGKTILLRNLGYLQKALAGSTDSQYQQFSSSLHNWLALNTQTAWNNRNANNIVDGNWSGQLLSSTDDSWSASSAVEALEGVSPQDITTNTPAVNPYNEVAAQRYSVGSGFITEGSSEGGLQLGGIQPGDYAEYKNVDFGSTGATGFIARAATATGGGNIEIRLDSLNGPTVGVVNVQGTGGWSNFVDADTALKDAQGNPVNITGTHDVYLVFTKTNDQYLFNLNWFKFTTTDPSKTDAYTRLKAGNFDTSSGLGTDSTYGFVNGVHNNAYAVYKGIDFGAGASGITAHIASGNQGGTIEVKLDSLNGPTVGVINIPALGSWNNWADIVANIDNVQAVGVHDVYLVFNGTNGSDYPCNLAWFTFTTVKGVARDAYSKLEAEDYTSGSGFGTETAGGETYLAGIYGPNNPYGMYNYVDFGSTSPTQFSVNAASATSGGTVEVRIDSLSGPVIATCPVSGTGGWQNFKVFTTNITTPVTGKHIVYVLFKGSSYLYNFDKFTFGDPSVFSQSTPSPTPVYDNIPPSEVENVQMVRGDGSVQLYWDGPYDIDGQKVKLTVFNQDGQPIGNEVDVNRGVQTAEMDGIDKGTNFTVSFKTADTFGYVSKGITVDSKDYPAYAFAVNGTSIKEGDTFEDYLPLNVKVWDNLHPVKSASVTIDGNTYAINPQTATADVDLAGNLGAKQASITINDTGGNSLQETFAFNVTTSVNSMQQFIARFKVSGDLTGPMIPQLSNALDQAQHQLDAGSMDQATQHMQDFVKLLNNEALNGDVKDRAKAILNTDAQWLINVWQGNAAK